MTKRDELQRAASSLQSLSEDYTRRIAGHAYDPYTVGSLKASQAKINKELKSVRYQLWKLG